MSRPALALVLLLGFAADALADGRQDLQAAFVRGLATTSFKATMVDLGTQRTVSTIEFQAPDRYRVTANGQPPSVIIGDTMYMSHDGQTMKMPMPKGSFGKFRNEKAIADLQKGVLVESLGPGMVGAEPARRYRFTSNDKQQPSTSVAWIGLRSGLVLQVETSGKVAGRPFSMRMSYTDYNSPKINITAPK